MILKHAIKGLEILLDNLLKEHERIMVLKSSNQLSGREAERITAKISVQLIEIKQELELIDNI
jgi:hypothetical protein